MAAFGWPEHVTCTCGAISLVKRERYVLVQQDDPRIKKIILGCEGMGYWEWAEDVLGGSQQTLSTTKIYDVVNASLFTYDRNSNILQAFCEAWYPKTNTLLTSAGELSISLWDLHILGGLPIAGSPYEEVVLETRELIGLNEKQVIFIPRSCEYLFAAFHHLKEGTGATQKVFFSKWTSFWYKKTLIYRPAPLRKEKKFARLKSTHNPNGVIPETTRWSSDQETIFSKLRVRSNKKDETYVAAFLSIRLCAFVFPKVENSIRPETFMMASMMAGGRKISLAVPVLATNYHGLNKISCSSQLDQVKVFFPIHYVYDWLAHYFKPHYPLAKGPSVPLIVAYSGEGATRYFDERDGRKRIYNREDIVWAPTMLTNSRPYYYVDNYSPQELESNYFMSLCFNYLPLRYGNSFIIEPYSPHRFGRQFGFYQNIPGFLENDICTTSLDEGIRFWRICTLYRSMSRAVFPPAVDPMEKPFSTNYMSWWEKAHGKFLENNLQALVDNVGLKSIIPLGGEDQAIEKHPLVLPFNTRVPQDTSQSTNEDQNWKRKRPNPVEIVEVQSVDSPSRMHTACNKELNTIGHPMVSPCNKPQVSDESIGGRTCKVKSSSKASSIPHDESLKRQTPNKITRISPMTNTAVSIFEGKSILSNRKKEFILGLWEDICNRLSKTRLELLSSYREKIIEIFEDMKKTNILDFSPLEDLLNSLFELAASYDQERSNMADKTSEDEKLELISKAKEHLESFKLEASEKVKKVSSCEKKLKRVVKKLQTLQQGRENLEGVIEATQKEVNEIQ
ncbi:uncharacterized protein [Nicotiana sylvestris]|uniref:uncharacterized protein n=1 Tax=Nicotiana sylvestris TaxID=4096 RepID=UPI00388CD46E